VAIVGQIGCADLLVTQKDNMGSYFFNFPAFAHNIRPKYLNIRNYEVLYIATNIY
jgi:hypothetical protein